MEIKFNFEKKHFAIFAIVLIIAGFSFVFAQNTPGSTSSVNVCTKDARICEDGTVVSRNPANNCEFNACPDGSAPEAIPTWENETHNVWHDASEIRVNINNIYYSLQTAIDAGLLGGGSGSVINNIIGDVKERFNTENANGDDFKKICTRTERGGASEARRLLRRIIEDKFNQDNKLKFIVETEGACRDQASSNEVCKMVRNNCDYSPTGSCNPNGQHKECKTVPTSTTICEPANTCPVYTVPQGFARQQTIS